jgi:ribose transport system permease protein
MTARYDQNRTQLGASGRTRTVTNGRAWFSPARLLTDQGLVVVLVLFGAVLSLLTPTFLTPTNLTNLVLQASILGVIALGMTFVIIGSGIDLSVGGVPAIVSVLAVGVVVNLDLPVWLGLSIAVGAGICLGCVNGWAITRMKVAPLIATLGTLSIAIGLAFAYSGGTSVVPLPEFYRELRRATLLGIPINIVIFAVLAILTHVVLTRTSFGRSLYAVGGNKVAAEMAGIRTGRVIFLTYVISAATASLGGILFTARLGAGSPQTGSGMELTVIAAVVIGGTSLFGGRGNVFGTVLGALLITMVTNAINLLGVPTAWDRVLLGVVILIAALMDVYRVKYTERLMARRT